MTVFINFLLTSNHLHPLQVENCNTNSRLVVDEDDNGIFRDERVKCLLCICYITLFPVWWNSNYGKVLSGYLDHNFRPAKNNS